MRKHEAEYVARFVFEQADVRATSAPVRGE
jgi:hypothetical protein